MNYENYLEQKTNTQMYEQRILDLASNYLSYVEHVYQSGVIDRVDETGVWVDFYYHSDVTVVFVPKGVITHAVSEVEWVTKEVEERKRRETEWLAGEEQRRKDEERAQAEMKANKERQKAEKKRKRDLELLASLKKEYPEG